MTTASQADAPPASSPVTPVAADFPIVGLGASAGGLAAFAAFFTGLPAGAEPGMAFVLVQHLAPDHESILCDLLRRYTRMPVFEIEGGMTVQPNCVYVIPPGRDLTLLDGTLQLRAPSAPRGRRLPIDAFFRSLAQDQRERAIGIVLSGTGSDGSQGVRAIKGEGGMVMAQHPASAEFDGMPRAALATGLVDYELPPAEMPAQLLAYAAHIRGKLGGSATEPLPGVERALQEIFGLLQAQTGHDFARYKPSTVLRRIERRMVVHRLAELAAYVSLLRQSPAEVDELFGDLLIGVTRFFRDPEAFAVLADHVIPALLAGKPRSAVVRIWTAGCSTGEEAYSIAMLLLEAMAAHEVSVTVQLFATDLDARAIAVARTGCYPASVVADLSPERLARFFTAEADGSGFRVARGLRDLVVFSEHDLLKDPPFSRLDLISCRNVLIYLSPALQAQLLARFHYALKPGGHLWLGTSEGVGDAGDRFSVLDPTAKVYRREANLPGARRVARAAFLPFTTAVAASLSPAGARAVARAAPPSLRETAERALLAQAVAAGALVDAHGVVLYLHGRTGRFLEPSPGDATGNNVLAMAREGLGRALTASLRQAVATGATVVRTGLRVESDGQVTTVDLTVSPVTPGSAAAPAPPLYLVMLAEAPSALAVLTPDGAAGAALAVAAHGAGAPAVVAHVAALEAELRAKDEDLQLSRQELASTTEELRSGNQELQSVNEELQASNEEVETSREELQSINEELAIVNAELQTKVIDLSRANNDMNNLLAGTGIATVFVDHHLRILRFTPAVSGIINLIATDVGRPLADLAWNLVGYPSLGADLRTVLASLEAKEAQVQALDGKAYTMRLQPYRTLDHVIEGAVISFVDVTEMVAAREALRGANDLLRLAVVVRDAHDAITAQDLDGRTLAWNPGAVRLYGWSEVEALALNVRDRIPEALREAALATLVRLSGAE